MNSKIWKYLILSGLNSLGEFEGEHHFPGFLVFVIFPRPVVVLGSL